MRSTTRVSSRARTLAVLLVLAALVTAAAPSYIRVRAGDTLSEIAHRHGTTVSVLRQLNDLPGNAVLYAGTRLRVPGSTARSRTRIVERGYTVRSGDSLSGIAKKYGVTVRTIRVRNRLPGNGRIVVGRRLAIPVRVSSAGAAAQPRVNEGVAIPGSVRSSAAHHRAVLRRSGQPSKAAVRRMVAQTARRQGVDVSLAVAVAYHESGFQMRVVSPVDAIGVMQVLPATARVLSRQYGRSLNLLKAQDNITAGVLLLRQLQRATGSAHMTLAGYYQGLGSISRQGLLPQTHSYIRSIDALRRRFARG